MDANSRPTPPAAADRPALRLLERPQRPLHSAPRSSAPLPAWRARLERWTGGLFS